jgi:phage FluMu gp28-like protein
LILDEFAFHEDSAAIWEAAEPILASNPDFLCRMASTGNGRHNLFYRMTEGGGEVRNSECGRLRAEASASQGVRSGKETEQAEDGGLKMEDGEETESPSPRPMASQARHELVSPYNETASRSVVPIGWGEGEEAARIFKSRAGYAVSRITRTQAHGMGVKIYDANTRVAVSPAEAREQALDKRAYDQNYECVFADENATLLSHELINAAEREDVGVICEQEWSPKVLAMLGGKRSQPCSHEHGHGIQVAGPLYVGFDVARKGDLSVITVMEELNGMKVVRAILRMRDLRLPEQQQRLGEICRLPKFRRAAIDMTGLGLGLFEYAQEEFGASRIHGINFATSVPATRAVRVEGRKREMVRVTEAMAMELLQVYEDRRIQHPADNKLRDDLRKPEKVTTPGGRVSIAATRDEAGHADHFWSFALALEAASHGHGTFHYQAVERRRRYLL